MNAPDREPGRSRVDVAAGGPSDVPPPRVPILTRYVLPLALLVATAALVVGAAWRTLFPGAEVTVLPVVVKTVEAPVGTASITATGWIEPDPYPYYATALIDGVVATVEVLEGDRVAKGDVIARLVDDDARLALVAAEGDLRVAEGEVARIRATLAAAEEHLESRIELRRRVATAEAAVAQRTAELTALDPAERALEAAAASIADELARKRPLVESGAVGAGEVERLGHALAGKRAEIDGLRAQRAVIAARVDAARADLDAAEESLTRTIDERLAVETARASLTRAEGEAAHARALRDDAALTLERTIVRAPIDGTVMRRLTAPGSPIQVAGATHSAHIAHLYDPAHLQVRVDVPLADAAGVGREQRAEITVSALPDQVFPGRVSRLVHEADLQKNTVEVKVAIEEPNPLLKPEMLARVRFIGQGGGPAATASRERIFVPLDLVRGRSGEGGSIWIVRDRVDATGTATARAIRLGSTRTRDDDGREWIEVTTGLRPGDALITSPPTDLSDGDPVTIADGRTP